MESRVHDYRVVYGVNIAHAGRTAFSLVRFDDCHEGNTRTRMEEPRRPGSSRRPTSTSGASPWTTSSRAPSDLREAKQDSQDAAAAAVKANAQPPLIRIRLELAHSSLRGHVLARHQLRVKPLHVNVM
ncbi:hypothetical protein ACP4OV_021049 [Aristida adscensionis]